MEKTPHNNEFLGHGWSFPPRFNTHNKEIELVAYEQDIKESLHILLSTTPGERIMQPAFGCGIKKMVFEMITESIITKIQNAVEQAILFFEPRINLEKVSVELSEETENESDIDDGRLNINISYTIRKTNTRSNIVYPFYFIEGSNVQI
ncbi:MAG TPA: hypothetical protein ENJ08_15620 [Gammaproteobacteria bacterium]|nr:hypothetical protein [Gammaproteobacteria bacterium]